MQVDKCNTNSELFEVLSEGINIDFMNDEISHSSDTEFHAVDELFTPPANVAPSIDVAPPVISKSLARRRIIDPIKLDQQLHKYFDDHSPDNGLSFRV